MKPSARNLLVGTLALALAACASDDAQLTPVTFADLPEWANDHHAAPLALFTDSCAVQAMVEKSGAAAEVLRAQTMPDAAQWQAVCAAAHELKAPDDAEARGFFETYFTPYRVTTEAATQGRITGYYEPLLEGSLEKTSVFSVPVYGVPDDLTDAPYLTRAQIEAGDMGDHAPVLLYVDDPVALFFLQIQGSGKVHLRDGSQVGLHYAARNHQPYVAIGRVLRERGALETVSMQTIRAWLGEHPEQVNALLLENPSYVFFELTSGDAYARGALDLPLTPLRSIAIDHRAALYGVPTYLVTTKPDAATGQMVPLRQLFVGQDTGTALQGSLRADIFYGSGVREAWEAGEQNTLGDVYWLLPNPVAVQGQPAPAMPEDVPEVPAEDSPYSHTATVR